MGIENPTPSLRRFQGITDLLLFQQTHCGPVEKAGFGAAISFDAGAIAFRDRSAKSRDRSAEQAFRLTRTAYFAALRVPPPAAECRSLIDPPKRGNLGGCM